MKTINKATIILWLFCGCLLDSTGPVGCIAFGGVVVCTAVIAYVLWIDIEKEEQED